MLPEASTLNGSQSVEELRRELAEAREQQTATNELLRVIGESHADTQPVFEALAKSAVRLCAAKQASIWRFDGQILRAVATHDVSPERKLVIEANPIAPGRASLVGRAALERRTIHLADALADRELTYQSYPVPTDPTRTVLVVPMLMGSRLFGVIFIHRNEVLPFSESQISLIESFADQAVIAVEKARLFEEVQARTRELSEALEQQ